ncbi:MAG: SDR family NAD(P)-dependent oxidoreductase [Candidatus Heimdallarchaeota archaeon]|nr:MAG: SDR family NAD(P)-dependent oxidoreductase [Candidatus Heimdallarchaeota archaeon]
MKPKICIVTGANRGIGKGIAKAIAKQGHQVVLVCRNAIMGDKVVKSLQQSFGETSAELVEGNLSSIKKVKAVGDKLLSKYEQINVLIHNAGVWPSKLNKTEKGIECAFMVNHLAPFYLTHQLLGRLMESAPSRIVLVNAGLYSRGTFNPELTPWGGDFSKLKTYMNSKLCGMLYMRKFAPMLEGSGVIINAVHPGVIRTGLGDFSGFVGILLKITKLFQRSVKFGARGPTNLASNSEITTNGSFYDKLERKDIGLKALDDELAEKLWNLSLELCGIREYGVYNENKLQ